MLRGIGVDSIEIERVARALKRWGDRFCNRFYTVAEVKYCFARRHPQNSLAGRLAAKEAVMKALGLGLGQCRWQDIEIAAETGGRPRVVLAGRAQERAHQLGMSKVWVSITHDRERAVAWAVAEGDRAEDSNGC